MTYTKYEDWVGDIFSGLSQSFAVFALVESGCLHALKENSAKAFTIDELAAVLKLDARILSGVLSTIALSETGIIEVDNDGKYRFGENGDWPLREGARGLGQIFVGGYSESFSNLLKSLTGQATYNRHFGRDSTWVAEGTFTFSQVLAPFVISELKKISQPRVLDLGCGTGRLLMDYAEKIPELRAVGVDIAEESITVAKKAAARKEMHHRLDYFVADVFELEKLDELKKYNINTLCAHFIFHEFLYERNNRLPELLASLKRAFPGSRLICTEFNALSTSEYRLVPLEKRMPMLTYHHLIHSLTDQGIPMPAEAWTKYFSNHGVTVERVKNLRDRQLSIYFLRL